MSTVVLLSLQSAFAAGTTAAAHAFLQVCGSPPVSTAAAAAAGISQLATSDKIPAAAAAAARASILMRLASQSGQAGTQGLDLSNIPFLAHHMPALFFDGMMRVMPAATGGLVDNCTLAALQLKQCLISTKCSAALRPNPRDAGRCATCGVNATCTGWWAGAAAGSKIGAVCDDRSALLSGFLCYKQGSAAPGLYRGLMGLI